jgi:hypothetical protein
LQGELENPEQEMPGAFRGDRILSPTGSKPGRRERFSVFRSLMGSRSRDAAGFPPKENIGRAIPVPVPGDGLPDGAILSREGDPAKTRSAR